MIRSLHSSYLFGILCFLCCCANMLLLACASVSQEAKILLRLKEVDWIDTHNAVSDWNASHQSPCSWSGISCDRSNAVTRVDLTNSLISGNLTSAICGLPKLTALLLQNNHFGGPFPDGLLECKGLRVLDLSQNHFTGALPDRIHQLTQLRVLNLSENGFSGSVPAGLARFTKIEELLLNDNNLTGTVPAFLGNLRCLTYLMMDNNPLRPAMVPKELGNLKRLQVLRLYNCSLVGNIPKFLDNLTQLERLDMSNNHLSGDIPTSLMALSKMTKLALWENNLSGTIPHNIGQLQRLSLLDLDSNQLSGEIPESISNLTELVVLFLNDNQLTGQIPAEIGQLRHLWGLQLFGNKLTGWLPQSLGTHSNIVFISVNDNELEGPLPTNLCRSGVLFSLSVYSNNFNGSVPSTLGNCESLNEALLQNNQLSGEIPEGLWSASNLEWLYLQNNKFEGKIPAAIGRAKNLNYLDLSNNRFGGRIPGKLADLRSLQRFNASNNQFSGPIPVLVGLSSIMTLQLDRNSLSGEIPKSIISLHHLTHLNLCNNQLRGEIPTSLSSMTALKTLDLSNNLLSGGIPVEIGSSKLSPFNVSNNHLSGPVPDTLDNSAYKDSFLGNPGLCGGLKLGLRPCVPSEKGKLLSQRSASILFPLLPFAVVALCFIYVCCVRIFCHKKAKGALPWKLTSFHLPLELDEHYILRNLTENNVIGSGVAGTVYKVTLPNRQVVAVKKIQNMSSAARLKRRAEEENKELDVEVNTLGLIRHKNILKLLCCISSEQADYKLLVYEYMANGSLFDRLHGVQEPDMALQWPIRYDIALGAACGLSYMHHDCSPPILHRDVKSSNILLGADYEAKVADFGLSKSLNKLGDAFSVSGYVGSYGYIAPEYAEMLKVNEKSDVYSFGVLLLELVSGKKATDDVEFGEGVDIVRWIHNTLWMGRGEHQLLDWRIVDDMCIKQMLLVLRVGLICTAKKPKERPSMKEAMDMLVMCCPHQQTEETGLHVMGSSSGVGAVLPTIFHPESENEEVSFTG